MEGVPQRRSATSSHKGLSPSWPMAETTGTGQAAMARHSSSSLQGSSWVASPPPRARMTTSTPGRATRRPSASTMAAADQAVGYQPLPRLGDHGGHGTLADRGHLLGFEGQLAPVVVPAEPADDDRPLPAHRPSPPGGPSRADDRDLGRPVAQGEIGPPCLRHL